MFWYLRYEYLQIFFSTMMDVTAPVYSARHILSFTNWFPTSKKNQQQNGWTVNITLTISHPPGPVSNTTIVLLFTFDIRCVTDPGQKKIIQKDFIFYKLDIHVLIYNLFFNSIQVKFNYNVNLNDISNVTVPRGSDHFWGKCKM